MKRGKIFSFGLLCLVLIFSLVSVSSALNSTPSGAEASASTLVVVTGKVTNEEGEAIPQVAFAFTDRESHKVVATAFTDPVGNYFVNVPSGIYDAWVSPAPGNGFHDKTIRDISIASDMTLDVVLGLVVPVRTAQLRTAEADPVEDLTPPDLLGLDFTPKSVDTNSESQSVTFTFRITDDLSGFDYAYFYIYSPSSQQYRNIYLSEYNRISGDALDGTYQVSAEFPQYSEGGTWHIDYISLQDKVTNRRYLNEQDLTNLGLPTEIEVKGTDIVPSQLEEFNFIPTSVDISNNSQFVTFTFRITDDISGFDYAYLYIYSPSDQQYRYVYLSEYNRISGDALDGTYQVSAEFPQYSEGGTWHVYYISLQDKVTNRRYLYEQDLINLGFPTEIEVVSIPDDENAPQLISFNFGPKSIDTSDAPQSVTFTLRITDDLSGFDYAYFYIYSPSSQQYRNIYLSEYNRISGDALDGTYQVSAEFPQYSEGGTWRVYYISLQDKVTNRRYLYEQDLLNLGFPTEIENSWEDLNVTISVDKGLNQLYDAITYERNEPIIITTTVTDPKGSLLFPLEEADFEVFVDGSKVDIEKFEKVYAGYEIEIEAPGSAGNYPLTVEVNTAVGDGEDTQSIVVPQERKALVIGITEYDSPFVDKLSPEYPKEAARVLRALGFKVTELIDENNSDGDVITYDEVTAVINAFKSTLTDEDVAALYINTHGGNIGDLFSMDYGDGVYFEDLKKWFWVGGTISSQLDDIGTNLDFLWLDTCWSWRYEDEIGQLGAGGIVFFGNEGEAKEWYAQSIIYDAIVGDCYEASGIDESEVTKFESNPDIRSVEIIGRNETAGTVDLRVCLNQQTYLERTMDDFNFLLVRYGLDGYLYARDYYPSPEDNSEGMDLLDPLLSHRSPVVYIHSSDEIVNPLAGFSNVDCATWDSDGDGLEDAATISWAANTTVPEENIFIKGEVYGSGDRIVKSYIYGPYAIHPGSLDTRSFDFCTTVTDVFNIELVMFDSNGNPTALAFITDVDLAAGITAPSVQDEFAETGFHTTDSDGDGVVDTIAVLWDVSTVLAEEDVSVLALVDDKVLKYGPYTIHSSEPNSGEIDFYAGDVGKYDVSLYLIGSDSELQDSAFLEVPLGISGFNDNYADSALDTDGDGKYDVLAVDVGINVIRSGHYTILGSLYDEEENLVLTTSSSCQCAEGAQTLQLLFDGQEIHSSGLNGPYVLRYLELYEYGRKLIGHRDQPYVTATYDFAEFEAPPAFVNCSLITPSEILLYDAFNVTMTINNPSSYILPSLGASLTLASEFDTTDPALVNVGDLEPGQTKQVSWIAEGVNPGYGEIAVSITSPDIENVSATSGVIVAHFSLTESTNKHVYVQGDNVVMVTSLTNDNPEICYLDLLADVTVQGPSVEETHSIPINYITSLETRSSPLTWDSAGQSPGDYTVTAKILEESRVLSETSTSFVLLSSNQPPIADAGPDQVVCATASAMTAVVTLDGFASYDPDGDPLTYNWTWDSGTACGVGPTVELPPGTTTITLVVNDGLVDSEPDSVSMLQSKQLRPCLQWCPPWTNGA